MSWRKGSRCADFGVIERIQAVRQKENRDECQILRAGFAFCRLPGRVFT